MKSYLSFDVKNLFSSLYEASGCTAFGWHEKTTDPALFGKKLGLVNGSAWIQLWGYYFGRLIFRVKLINVGNEAVQLNFMRAHAEGKSVPPGKISSCLPDMQEI